MGGQCRGHTTNRGRYFCPKMWPKICPKLWGTKVFVEEIMPEFVGRILVLQDAVERHDFG
jgi:hypothetical protein